MQHGRFKDTFRQLPNVVALATLFEDLLQNPGISTLASFSGPSGFGKTFGATYCVLEYGPDYVECQDHWTYKDLLMKIAGEMGLNPKGTKTELFDRICAHLNLTRNALLLDDAHLLTKKGLPRFARHVSDQTGVPVILIGEETLPLDLTDFPDVVGRIGKKRFVQASPASLLDVNELAGVWTPDLDLSDGLRTSILETANGSLRTITQTLRDIGEHARVNRLKTADVTILSDLGLEAPDGPPKPRNDAELGRRPAKIARVA